MFLGHAGESMRYLGDIQPISVFGSMESATSDNHLEHGADRGALLAAVSNTIVGLHKRYYGKGPTKARSYLLDDMLVCVLRGGMTRAEQTLLESGRGEQITRQRHEFQMAIRDQFVSAVQDLTGQTVTAFLSTSSPDPDVSVEIFMLDGNASAD
jgi:uncharacterized protein YbcI